MSTPAERLNAAAQRLRDLADACPPWPWTETGRGDEVRAADGIPVAEIYALSNRQIRATMTYIAAMHPGVANAIADLLDAEVREIEQNARYFPQGIGLSPSCQAALALADLVLAGDADDHA